MDNSNIDGFSANFAAAEICQMEVLRELLNRDAGMDISKKYGWTPVNAAACYGHVEVVRELLNYGARMDIANT
jgi:ankyrin repeat protein